MNGYFHHTKGFIKYEKEENCQEEIVCPQLYDTENVTLSLDYMIDKMDLSYFVLKSNQTCIPKEYVVCTYCPTTATNLDLKHQPYFRLRKIALHTYRRYQICTYTPTNLCTNWGLAPGKCSSCKRYWR